MRCWVLLVLGFAIVVVACMVGSYVGAALCVVVLLAQAFCSRLAEAIAGPEFVAERCQPAETHDQWLQNGHGTDLYSESQWLERSLKHRSDGQRKGPETAP